ncbi:MAG: ABC transporter permease [Anaerolineae bacterium]|nr:ABC transporter permease [Anaerolineae bacterium]
MHKGAVRRYVLRRLAIYFLTIFGSFTIAFVFFHLIPGDPIGALLTSLQSRSAYLSQASQEMVDHYKEFLGLGGSLPEQYIRYISNVLLRFDFGPSLVAFPTPSQELIFRALPWTIGLLGLSVIISWILGIIVGGIVGWLRTSRASGTLTLLAIAFSQIPQYIVALMLLFIFAFTLAWLPVRNAYPANITPGLTIEFVLGVIRHGLLPAFAIVLVSVSGWILSTRSLVVSILGEDYLLYAQAKGLSKRNIFIQYVLRNALLPQLTALAISLGFIVNGALLVETLFNYPGLGSLLVTAVGILDFNTIQGIVLISIFSVLTANLVLDLALPLVDPRIRTGA